MRDSAAAIVITHAHNHCVSGARAHTFIFSLTRLAAEKMGNCGDDDDVAGALEACKSTGKVILSWRSAQANEKVAELCAALLRRGVHDIQSLDLSDNSMTDAHAAMLAECFMHSTSPLRIDASGNSFGEAGATALAKIPSLRALDVTGNDLGTGGEAFCAALEQRTELEELHLGGCVSRAAIVARVVAMAGRSTALRVLNLAWHDLMAVTAKGVTCAELLARAMAKNTSIRTLVLEHCFLPSRAVAFIVRALRGNRTLCELCLDCNRISGDAGAALGEYLAMQDCPLQSLSLPNCHATPLSLRRICEGVRCSRRLTKLCLDENGIYDAGAAVVADAVRNCATFTTLYMTRNEVKDAGAAALASVFAACPKFEEMDLSFNQVGDAGAAAFAQALADVRTCKVLNLDRNARITEVGSRALARAVVQSRSMEPIEVFGNTDDLCDAHERHKSACQARRGAFALVGACASRPLARFLRLDGDHAAMWRVVQWLV